MEGASPTRRLAAIVCMDVAGYSRLMGADEEGTLARVQALQRDVIEPALAAHRGRLVKTAGDGFLAEFASVVDAVRSAAAVQRQVGEREAAEPEARRITLRIGINLGDVIVEGGDLHGDGVNIAARLEAIAEPGTICLSGAAYEHVRDRVDLAFEDAGEQALKNLARPVRVWRARIGAGAAPASGAPLQLPDKPSIAVLPFANLSGDPDQEYFADGMVEEIITALSHFPRLFVIARNSSFTYKGRPGIDIRQVGRELGVRYVLEGSVRRAGERVRIAGQLIDASSGAHLWADRFDGVLADIFDLQDTMARSIVGAIEPRLMSAEVERAQRKRAASLDAYDLYLRALPNVYAATREGNDTALSLLKQALAIDPDYAVAAGLASCCYVQRESQRWQTDPETEKTEKQTATDLAHHAIAKGPNDPEALAMGGLAIAVFGDELRAGLAAIERAIGLNPNSALALNIAGWVHLYLGEAAVAVMMFERAMRQSPRDPTIFQSYAGLSWAHLFQERFEDAELWAQRAVAEKPNWTTSLRSLAAALGHLGRVGEARAVIERLRALVPDETITSYAPYTRFRSSGRLPLILEGLRKAGLPE
jgi:adenylate cyclase